MRWGAVRDVRVGIVADDFTSAMDGAGPFIDCGVIDQARIATNEHHRLGDAGLVAIDVDSRRREPSEAGALVASAVARLRAAPLLLKTVDSTMRGHVRVELEAAWRESGRRQVILAPAFPARGRTTVQGVQLVDGIEVSSTAFGIDSRHPIGSAAIGSVLAPLPHALWPGGNRPMPSASIVVADASSDDDLDELVQRAEAPDDVLWVGSPGLAAALARNQAAPGQRRSQDAVTVRRLAIVVGSSHPINESQLATLRVRLDQRLRVIEEAEHAGDCEVAVLAPLGAAGRVGDAAAASHRSSLARRAAALVRAGFDGLIVTGGETARAVISSLGEPDITVLGELTSGIVAARLDCSSPVTLVTKAGGFGGPDTLLALYRQLTGSAE